MPLSQDAQGKELLKAKAVRFCVQPNIKRKKAG